MAISSSKGQARQRVEGASAPGSTPVPTPVPTSGEPRALLTPALMARVRQIQIRTHKLVNTGLSGGYRSTFRGQGIEFEEVRPYQPGDEVRAIDWNVTARTGEPFIKSYREERQLTIHLCVDTSLELDFATFGETKRDAASEVAALISFVGIRHQDRIGLTLFGQEPGLHLGPGRQSRHVLRMIREIQAAAITQGPSSLRSLLEGQAATLHKRSMVFVISDFSGVGADGAEHGDRGWVEALSRLSRRHDVIAIRLVDRFEEELPAAGIVRLARMEDGAVRDIDGRRKRVREAWSNAAAAREEALGTVFRQARTEWIDIRTDGDLGAPLVRFFRQRVQGPRGGNQKTGRSSR